MRSIFETGAVSIATTVHGTPAKRAAYATPWPALPALIVQTPRWRSLSGIIATALTAPRNLYELVGCKFSSLRRISGKFGPKSSRINGVRATTPATLVRASRISDSCNGRIASNVIPSSGNIGHRSAREKRVHDGDEFDRLLEKRHMPVFGKD